MEKTYASTRISVLIYLIIRVSGCFVIEKRRTGGQDVAASPFVVALVHRGCRRFSVYMGNRGAAQTGEARAQPRFGQTGSGYAAKRHMLFQTFREC